MSSNSYNSTCPNCGGQMETYSDSRPVEHVTHDCLHCGFFMAPTVGYLPLCELNELREERELKPLKVLPKQLKEIL